MDTYRQQADIRTLQSTVFCHKVEEDEVGGTCGMNGGEEECV
jgi:hypothetical protein